MFIYLRFSFLYVVEPPPWLAAWLNG